MEKSGIKVLAIISILMVVVFKRTPNALGHLYHPDKEEEEELKGSHL